MRPLLEHDDAVAQALDLAHVVRGEQHGRAALAAIVLEPAAHPVGSVGIERGGRLVEQQDLRLVDQRLRERHAGLLAGRQLAGRPVEEFVQVEFLGQRADAAGDVVAAIEHAEHVEVLPHREPHRHVDVGAFEIHPVQHAMPVARHLDAQHGDVAGGRLHQAHDGGDGGGLAGAVAAEQRRAGARLDGERDAVHRGDGLVALDQAVDGDG